MHGQALQWGQWCLGSASSEALRGRCRQAARCRDVQRRRRQVHRLAARNRHDVGVCNAQAAPVIEYRRTGESAGTEGRLYWPRGMCADGPFEHAHRRYAYDVVAFERWWRQTDRSMGEITCTSAAARGCTAAVCVPRCRTKDREPACLRGQLVSGQLMESATIDGKNREALDGRCALQCGHEHPQHLSKNCCTGR